MNKFSKAMWLTRKRKVDIGHQKLLSIRILSFCIWPKISGIDTQISLLFVKHMRAKIAQSSSMQFFLVSFLACSNFLKHWVKSLVFIFIKTVPCLKNKRNHCQNLLNGTNKLVEFCQRTPFWFSQQQTIFILIQH